MSFLRKKNTLCVALVKVKLLLAFFLILEACSTPKQGIYATAPADAVKLTYQEIPKNLERLDRLLKGSFLIQNKTADDGFETWKLASGDSIWFVGVQIGRPEKDGYWYFFYQYISSMPNQPLVQTIMNLEPHPRNRDSFYINCYQAPLKLTFDDIKFPERIVPEKINLTTLKPAPESYVMVKKKPHFFVGKSNAFIDVSDKNKKRKLWRMDIIELSPETMRMNIIKSKERDIENAKDRIVHENLLRREVVDLNLFDVQEENE